MTPESFIYKYNETRKNVIITKYKENCYIANSFQWQNDSHDLVDPIMSFIYFDGKEQTVEWGPPHGPISINRKCLLGSLDVREDFFLGFAQNDWTQLGVNKHKLPEKALNNIDAVFAVLKDYIDET